MKRVGNLFERIVERDNLRLAFYKASRGKRYSAEVRHFSQYLDYNLEAMASQVRAGTFPVGQFHQFRIYDPKERIIAAPSFPERVLHHAIMNLGEPVFDRWLIDDSYACRVGRGRNRAVDRARDYANRHRYFLKLDIRKYFDSISHEILLRRLQRRFKDVPLLELFERIIRSFRGPSGHGLPIGCLTSQHFANFYLGWCDRFVKEELRIPGYVRYMDDMALWSNDKSELKTALQRIDCFLADELQLVCKDYPYLNRTEHGMDFLGCRVFRFHITLNGRSRRRFWRKLGALERAYSEGELSSLALQQRATSLVSFARSGAIRSWQFRTGVLSRLSVRGQELRTE